ncbi:MAG: succinylglutamate desuccinylase/aspartoacylase family protein [Spirochaetales bacterium]|nr:succinylglutamate desuccinylase/aspartoacylase family protein [Spirochaetales bacterium]
MAFGSSLEVACPGRSLKLPLHRFEGGDGRGGPRLLIVAGVHGREHSGIRTAFALIERLAGLSDIHGVIEILPVANPRSFAAETRENPADGRNLGECFTRPASPGPSVAGPAAAEGRPSQTQAIAGAILDRLEGCSHLLDLHSAGEARYLPHALFFREDDAPSAAAAGLPFALLRRKTREGAVAGTLSRAALAGGIPALALELGGGITTWTADIDAGIRGILSLLARWNYLSWESVDSATPPDPTPAERMHMQDDRSFLRAWEEGAFYPSCEPGRELRKGERIGTWISLKNLEAEPVAAPEAGLLIYLRSRCRTHSGDTLAMLLPPRGEREGQM